MTGILTWAAPTLQGARLIGVFDTEGGEALARFDVPDHGRVNLFTPKIDGELVALDDQVGLGIVEELTEDGQDVTLSGSFGWLRFGVNSRVEMLDHWSGTLDRSAPLLGHAVPEQQLAGTVLIRPDVQIRISRRDPGGEPIDTVISARQTVALQTWGDLGTLFSVEDVTMRVLEMADLLGHPQQTGPFPTADEPVGALVVVQLVHGADRNGVLSGGEFAWLECGRTGWVQLVEDGARRPTPVAVLAADLVAAIVGPDGGA